MIIYFDNNRKINGINKKVSVEQAEIEIAKGNSIWLDGEFGFDLGIEIDGKIKEFYLNEDNTIRVEYVNIPVEPLTETEMIMQTFTDLELHNLEIQKGQEMLAQQIADIELAVLGGGTTV